MSKRIFSVEFDIPGGDVEYIAFNSDQSLLDADIVVFEPSFVYRYHGSETYNGKRLLDRDYSFKIVEHTAHWRSELKVAFDTGKTIFIFLSKLEEVYRYTGEKQFSGSGRSRVTTNIVTGFNNYEVFPVVLGKLVPRGGKEIRVARDLKYLSTYWKEFAEYSVYEIYFEGGFKDVVLSTKAADKVVGAVMEGPKGTMILLPPLRFDEDAFTTRSGNWNAKGIAFGKRLVAALIEIDKALKGNREFTPPPEWTKSSEYRLDSEAVIETEINGITHEIEKLQGARSELLLELEREGNLRALLYERGAPLERAILDALRIMGFQAENFKESESEFDAVFSSEEGRFLGEVEGKDNKAVNIDKLSQLERNIQEDYARDEVTEFAKGVLFGNAHRFVPPAERGEFFTQKCVSGAKRLKVALVRTPDLFAVSKYLKESNDSSFAKECREVILNTEGEIVQFPSVPAVENGNDSNLTAESETNPSQ